jgi:hypothetical protein
MLRGKGAYGIYPNNPALIGAGAPAMLAPIFGKGVGAFEQDVARNATESSPPSSAP